MFPPSRRFLETAEEADARRRLEGLLGRDDTGVLVALDGASVVGLGTVHVFPVIHAEVPGGQLTALVVVEAPAVHDRRVGAAVPRAFDHQIRTIDERGRMLETPKLLDAEERQAAVIHITVPRAGIQDAMGLAFNEVMQVVKEQGITPAGPFFSHHRRMDPDVFDFELGLPIPVPISPVGRVRPGKLPGGRVAQAVYRGPYEGLGEAWSQFGKWLKANGQATAENL